MGKMMDLEMEKQIAELDRQIVISHQQQQYEKALALLTQQRGLVLRHLGSGHQRYAEVLNDQAVVYLALNDLVMAEQHCRQAQEIVRTSVGEDNVLFAACLQTMADIYKPNQAHALSESEALYQQALDCYARAGADSDPLCTVCKDRLTQLQEAMAASTQDSGAAVMNQRQLEAWIDEQTDKSTVYRIVPDEDD